jgi:hypothetical protein
MLADPRSDQLIRNFAGHSLGLRDLRDATPDAAAYPQFDADLRAAFARETELFVASVLRENRPASDLIGARYTFLNERLARHYGIPGVAGPDFRRVTLTDPRRGGLLAQGSILTVTSYANLTSIVKRGKWILENLMASHRLRRRMTFRVSEPARPMAGRSTKLHSNVSTSLALGPAMERRFQQSIEPVVGRHPGRRHRPKGGSRLTRMRKSRRRPKAHPAGHDQNHPIPDRR